MPNRLPDINLLPEIRQESPLQAILFYIFVGLIVVAFIGLGYLYFSTNNKLSDAQTESTQLEENRDVLEIKLGNLEDQGGSANYEKAISFAEYYQLPTSTLITEFNELLPDDSYISTYTYNSSQVNVTTHFESLDVLADYTKRLTNSDYVIDATVGSISTFSLKEETEGDDVNFDVIPRYEGDFSLMINKEKVREESTEDE